ncbi:hypothetical protein CR513_53158, partial [Mucuna pruriens]
MSVATLDGRVGFSHPMTGTISAHYEPSRASSQIRRWKQKPNPKPDSDATSMPGYQTPNHSVIGWRRAFERKHGNILNILDIEVQPAALEEAPHYFHRGQSPSWSSVAKLLRLTETKILREKTNRNGLEGIQISYIEERLYQFREDGDWPAFMDAYGFLVYGIVQFPHGDAFVDLVLAYAYLAKRDGEENPAMALLANTYCTMNHCCERKGGNLRCCIHLLYLWMTAHLFHSKLKTACPVEDFKWC